MRLKFGHLQGMVQWLVSAFLLSLLVPELRHSCRAVAGNIRKVYFGNVVTPIKKENADHMSPLNHSRSFDNPRTIHSTASDVC